MNKHCKGCVHHHNAGHKNPTKQDKQYNDWCCKGGKTAKKVVGICKLFNLKKETNK